MSTNIEDTAAELNSIVSGFYAKHKGLGDEITSKRLQSEDWTIKEIIGHLIDSATNNHQRFVRLQIVDALEFPGYGRDNLKWVEIQKYNLMSYSDLFLLWKQYNIFLAHIIKNMDAVKLGNCWVRSWEQAASNDREPDREKVPLADLITSYTKHLRNHLNQFDETLEILKKG